MRFILILLSLFLFSCASVKVASTEKRAKKQLHKTIVTYNAITSAYPKLKEVRKQSVATKLPSVEYKDSVLIPYDTAQYDTSLKEVNSLLDEQNRLINSLEISKAERAALHTLNNNAANKIERLQTELSEPRNLNYYDDILDVHFVVKNGSIVWVHYELKERPIIVDVDKEIVTVDSGIRKSLSAEIFSLILLAALFIAIAFFLYRFSIYLRTK